MDQEIRKLNYYFFKLPAVERLGIMMSCAMITEEMAKLIPTTFFRLGFDNAILHGGADHLANHPWIKELEKKDEREREEYLASRSEAKGE